MPAPVKTQLEGGAFQDSLGNVLVNGYLRMVLNQDGLVTSVGQICSGVEINIPLDSSGNVVTSPVQSVWGNDNIVPLNSFYIVSGFTAAGQLAWGPNNQQVTGSSPFDCGTWVPNQLISWTPPLQVPLLQTNEVVNGAQNLLDLHAGSGMSLVDNGQGRVTLAATGIATPITLETNHSLNASQVLLDLSDGNGTTVVDHGAGVVSIEGVALKVNATPNASQLILDLTSGTGITVSDQGAGVVRVDLNPILSKRSAGWNAPGNSTVNNTQRGVVVSSSDTTRSDIAPTATDGAGYQGGSALASGSGPVIQSSFAVFSSGSVYDVIFRYKLNQTVTERMWLALTDTASSVFLGDNPTGNNVIGFRYSTVVGDTQFTGFCSDGAASATSHPTSINADNSVHTFRFTIISGTVTFYIDGTQIGQLSAHVPAAGTALRLTMQLENRSGGASTASQICYYFNVNYNN